MSFAITNQELDLKARPIRLKNIVCAEVEVGRSQYDLSNCAVVQFFLDDNHAQTTLQSLMIQDCTQEDCSVGAFMAFKDSGAEIVPLDFSIMDFWSPTTFSLLSRIDIGHVRIGAKLGNALLFEVVHCIKKFTFGKIAIHNPMLLVAVQVRNNVLDMAEILINEREFLRFG